MITFFFFLLGAMTIRLRAQDDTLRRTSELSIGTNFFPAYFFANNTSVDQRGFIISFRRIIFLSLSARAEILYNNTAANIIHPKSSDKEHLIGFAGAVLTPPLSLKRLHLTSGINLVGQQSNTSNAATSFISNKYLIGPLVRISYDISKLFAVSTEFSLAYGKIIDKEYDISYPDTAIRSYYAFNFYKFASTELSLKF